MQNAFAAFGEGINAFPYHDSGFVKYSGTQSVDAIFEATPGIKQLANIVDRLTHLGAVELLLPGSAISLLSARIPDDSVTGALLERQLSALERFSKKDGVKGVIVHLLADALSMYDARAMPVRRSRVLVTCLEMGYYGGVEEMEEIGVGSNQEMGEEVERLLGSGVSAFSVAGKMKLIVYHLKSPLGQDAGLVGFCAQYRASAHLWLALHAHRRVDPNQAALIMGHVEEATRVLRTLVGVTSPKQISPKVVKKLSPKKASVTKRGAQPAAVTRLRGARSVAAARDPVTPKPRARKGNVSIVSMG